MTKREEVIVQLLERWDELVEPGTMLGMAGDGDSVPLPPRTYNDSVKHLESLLGRMREERRSQWWHVTQRYVNAQEALKDVPVKRKAKNGKTVTVIERQLKRTWDPKVREAKAEKGIAWLASQWRLGHEPFLPKELMVAA